MQTGWVARLTKKIFYQEVSVKQWDQEVSAKLLDQIDITEGAGSTWEIWWFSNHLESKQNASSIDLGSYKSN